MRLNQCAIYMNVIQLLQVCNLINKDKITYEVLKIKQIEEIEKIEEIDKYGSVEKDLEERKNERKRKEKDTEE